MGTDLYIFMPNKDSTITKKPYWLQFFNYRRAQGTDPTTRNEVTTGTVFVFITGNVYTNNFTSIAHLKTYFSGFSNKNVNMDSQR